MMEKSKDASFNQLIIIIFWMVTFINDGSLTVEEIHTGKQTTTTKGKKSKNCTHKGNKTKKELSKRNKLTLLWDTLVSSAICQPISCMAVCLTWENDAFNVFG